MHNSLPLSLALVVALAANTSHAQTKLCIDTNSKNWLLNNERVDGAHTKTCHIDPKESQLIKRVQSGIQGCRKQRIASAFRNLSVARTVIKATLVQNTRNIQKWFREAKAGGKPKAFTYTPRQSRAAGISVTTKNEESTTRGKACKNRAYICEDAKKVKVVLKKLDEHRCFILTAYPEN